MARLTLDYFRIWDRAGLSVAVLMMTGAIMAAGPAEAAKSCSLAKIAAGYHSGLDHFQRRDYRGAWARWAPLARAGLGPAQRHVAAMFSRGAGVKVSPERAAFWSALAFRDGDLKSRRLAPALRAKLDDRSRQRLSAGLKDWRASRLDCAGSRIAVVKKDVKSGPLNIPLRFERRVRPDLQQSLQRGFPAVVTMALNSVPASRLYLDTIKTIEFYPAARYDRYVGWRVKPHQHMMRVSSASMDDQSPVYLAKTIVLSAKRRVYGRLSDATFADPYLRVIEGVKVYGSVYPDIRNGEFFKIVRRALAMAKDLPPKLRRYVDIIDEIHYSPLSKHYIRSGVSDALGAFYDRIIGADQNRLIFVRREPRFSSPLYYLGAFVHEGTHAVQDQLADRWNHQIPKLRHQLAKLEAAGQTASAQAKQVRKDIDRKHKYVSNWLRGIKTATGRIADISFECEALANEVETARWSGAHPSVMKDSGYLGVCPNIQQKINKWQDELTLKSRRR